MADAPARAPFPDGLHPFWFWNARIEPEEIRWQIAQMAEQGVRGFFIHSRQGLEQPYLSAAFLDLVEVALDEARRRGLTVHLYDEYPYPSGAAGGAVALGEPRFEATQLSQRTWNATGGAIRIELPRGAPLRVVAHPLEGDAVDWAREVDLMPAVGMVLSARSYVETGLTAYNRKRFFAQEPVPVIETTLPPGKWRVFASAQERIQWHKYWGTFIDVLDPEAVRKFLRLTHERYASRFGERLRGFASIFVDETEPRWSPRLIPAWREAYGEELPPLLTALQDGSHPRHLEVTDRLRRLQLRLFEESWEEPYSRWCAAHGIRYSGEKPSWRLSQLRWMDIPGCEPGHTKAGAGKHDLLRPHPRQNARATASAAYFYGKEGSLCECYHSLGWSGTLQDAKLIAESLLLMGTRWLVPHGFFYTTHGLAKHDAPPTFFFQMPYWPLFGRMSKRMERIAARFGGTWIDAEIVLVDPASGLPTGEDLAVYEGLMHALGAAQLDFHVVDTDILEAGAISAGSVRLRDVVARIVVLPPMRLVEAPLAAWVERFAAAGGIVVRMAHGDDPRATVKRLLAQAQPRLRLTPVSGSVERVLAVTRRGNDGRCWLLINTASEPVDLAIDAGGELRELPLDELSTPLLRKEAGAWRRALAPYESALIEEGPSEGPPPPPRLVARIAGRCRVTPLNANLLRLAEWELSLPEAGDGSARVAPMPLANQLDQGRLRFTPRFEHGFGTTPGVRLPRLRARYRCEFANAFSGAVELVMEPGSVVGDWSLRLNGSRPFVPSDFKPTAAHVRGSLGLDVTALLERGRNRIEIELETDRLDGGLLNPLYLAGGFAVTADPSALAEPRAQGAFEDWEGNGLPYYAGAVEYALKVDLTPPAAGEALVELAFAEPFEDCAEVSFNGGAWHPAPWSPRLVRVPASELRKGTNEVRIRVRTTLIRAFEAQWFDQRAHTYRKVGERAG